MPRQSVVEDGAKQAGHLKMVDLLRTHCDSLTAINEASSNILIGDLKNIEVQAIIAAGKRVNWSRKKMCEILGISQSSLWRKMKASGIPKQNGEVYTRYS